LPVSGSSYHIKPRIAVVVPNGTLFTDGIAARIKEDLLKNFNLHTIVRLPEPYTNIPANLIFFDCSGPTQDIWFYQIPPPEGQSTYGRLNAYEDAFAIITPDHDQHYVN